MGERAKRPRKPMTQSRQPESTFDTPRPLHIGVEAMHALRTTLERETGQRAATILQETGFAAGDAFYTGLRDYVKETYGVAKAEALDGQYLSEALSGYLHDAGWGDVSVEQLGSAVLAVDSPNWAESRKGGATYPACHFSTGSFADLFTRLGGSQTAVIEVECRSKGDDRCRFLVGSPETLTTVYERMAAGLSYQQSLGLESDAESP